MNILRLKALLKKEIRQMLRDPSTFAIGIILPIVMILIFGFGISLDLKRVNCAVINEDKSGLSLELIASLNGSPYLKPHLAGNLQEALILLKTRKVQALLYIKNNFANFDQSQNSPVLLVVDGTDASNAAATLRYVNAAFISANLKLAERSKSEPNLGVYPVERIWFNAANTSSWYLVPGLIVIIMSLVGTFLTATLIAKEWENGTFEMLFATSVSSFEIIIAKIVPHLIVGIIGLLLCLVSALTLFKVPLYGSLLALIVSSLLYLAVSLSMGIAISALTKNQFLAFQIVVIATFLPAAMLSGFLFDLRNVPQAIQIVGNILPATHFMQIIKASFLAGDNWSILIKKWFFLILYLIFFINLTRIKTHKLLE